jgi:hypothetical protein
MRDADVERGGDADEDLIILRRTDIGGLRLVVLDGQTGEHVGDNGGSDVHLLDWTWDGFSEQMQRLRRGVVVVALEGRSRCEGRAEVKHMECEEGSDQQQSQASNRVLILVLSIRILPKERTLDPQHGSGDSLVQAHVEVLFDVGLDPWADEIARFRVGGG